MREYDLTNKLEKIICDFRLENEGGIWNIGLQMFDYLGQIGMDFDENPDFDLDINNHNPLRPNISIDQVKNLFIDREPDTIRKHTFLNINNFPFVSWKSKSKRRSFKKKLKKIVKEANELYQKMRLEKGHKGESLEGEMFEDRMY